MVWSCLSRGTTTCLEGESEGGRGKEGGRVREMETDR